MLIIQSSPTKSAMRVGYFAGKINVVPVYPSMKDYRRALGVSKIETVLLDSLNPPWHLSAFRVRSR